VIATPFQNAGIFLTNIFFDFFIGLVLIRFIFQLVRADFHNPLAQFVVKVTSPVLKPFRKIIPGIAGIDVASIVVLLILQVIKMITIGFINTGHMVSLVPMSLLGLSIIGLAQLIQLTLTIYSFAIFIIVILSWIPQAGYNPFAAILSQLTEPVLRPARKYIPPIGGLDLSPLIVLIMLQLLKFLVADPIEFQGASLLGR